MRILVDVRGSQSIRLRVCVGASSDPILPLEKVSRLRDLEFLSRGGLVSPDLHLLR